MAPEPGALPKKGGNGACTGASTGGRGRGPGSGSDETLRVLLIPSSDYVGHPFPQRHNHLFERINRMAGFEVHVVRFNIFGRREMGSGCVIHEIPSEIRAKSTALYYPSNALSHLAEMLRIVRQESIDVVVAGNLLPPLLYRLAGKLHERKVPLVFDLQDYYPTSAAGYMPAAGAVGPLVRGLFEGMTRYLMRSADAVTAPGVALAGYARAAGARRVEVIPNGISEHFLSLHDGRGLRAELGLDGTTVIGYVGSVEFWLDMEPLLKGVSAALRRGANVRLLIIGRHLQTGYPAKVRGWIDSYGIGGATTWLDFVPHAEVPRYISIMDMATIPFDVSNPTAYYAAPNKMWEYLSQKKPVLATPIPETVAARRYLELTRTAEDYARALTGASRNGAAEAVEEGYLESLTRRWSVSSASFASLLRGLCS